MSRPSTPGTLRCRGHPWAGQACASHHRRRHVSWGDRTGMGEDSLEQRPHPCPGAVAACCQPSAQMGTPPAAAAPCQPAPLPSATSAAPSTGGFLEGQGQLSLLEIARCSVSAASHPRLGPRHSEENWGKAGGVLCCTVCCEDILVSSQDAERALTRGSGAGE